MRPDFQLDEAGCREDLWPLTLLCPVADLRFGIFTVRERWEALAERHPSVFAGRTLPSNLLPDADGFSENPPGAGEPIPGVRIERAWELPVYNDKAIRLDFTLLTEGRQGRPLPESVKVTGPASSVFVEPGARLEHCMLNTVSGPVYIGPNALVMDGAVLRGPVAVCEGAVVKSGAIVYGATTIGPGCIVGGEVKNSVLMDRSNKAHHGYLGDSVVGRWCNLGAGTSGSNVRNNGGPVKVWNMRRGCFETAGLKCGLVMGDHCRTAIDTSFNTGTVVGMSANVFGAGVAVPKFVPSFSWGIEGGVYELEKAVRDMRRWMAFKGQEPDEETLSTVREQYKTNSSQP